MLIAILVVLVFIAWLLLKLVKNHVQATVVQTKNDQKIIGLLGAIESEFRKANRI